MTKGKKQGEETGGARARKKRTGSDRVSETSENFEPRSERMALRMARQTREATPEARFPSERKRHFSQNHYTG
jgi:hypothetical protein